jgi:pyrroline-5-carboxylate reductase
MNMARIGFIGAGNMATALIKAVLDSGMAKDILASDNDKAKLEAISKLGIKITEDNREVVKSSDIIFLAVKPQVMDGVLEGIKEEVNDDKIIVSIAAGINIAKIGSILGGKKIVRVMPNAPCLVGEMAAGFSVNDKLTEDETKQIEKLLSSAGKAFRLKEGLLDAVTGLSGSGPAFVAYLIQAFKEAGKENGLDDDTAHQLALKTFEGTAKLLAEKDLKPEELIKMVSSPNGTTVAGREILESSDVKEIIKKTIARATERSRELGE